VKALQEYIVSFKNLKQGTWSFTFKVDNSFFEEFECTEFEKADFKVDLQLVKQSSMMILNFKFKGNIVVPCDRCLDEVEIEVVGQDKLIVKYGPETEEETEEILVVSENENEINVANHIYEFIKINIPQRKVHEEGNCNEKVIRELGKVEIKIDPRWADLKKLKSEK